MSELNVNMGKMDDDSEGFDLISTVADQIGSYLRNALAGLGNFWGDDKVGKEFIDVWDPGVQGLLGFFSGVGDGMRSTSLGIKTSSNLYRKSNDVNTELAG